MATAMFDLAVMDSEARAVAGGAGRLGWREARAVLLGCADAERRDWSFLLHREGKLARFASWLLATLGIEPVRPLASERLEALRLYACLWRQGDHRADPAFRRLSRLGLSPSQLAEVHAIVTG